MAGSRPVPVAIDGFSSVSSVPSVAMDPGESCAHTEWFTGPESLIRSKSLHQEVDCRDDVVAA
jgi:hypothetical protein